MGPMGPMHDIVKNSDPASLTCTWIDICFSSVTAASVRFPRLMNVVWVVFDLQWWGHVRKMLDEETPFPKEADNGYNHRMSFSF